MLSEIDGHPRATRAEMLIEESRNKAFDSRLGHGGGKIPVQKKFNLEDARYGRPIHSPIGGEATVLSVQPQKLVDHPLVIYKVVKKGQVVKPSY